MLGIIVRLERRGSIVKPILGSEELTLGPGAIYTLKA